MERLLKHLDIELTKKCNWNCQHCSAGLLKKENELTLEEVITILDKARDVKRAGFTGGEPLLVPEKLYTLLDFCKGRGIKTHIHTNGELVSEENISKFCDVESLSIPFLGMEKSHDIFANKQGSFKKLVGNIHLLNEAGINYSCYIIPNRLNYKEIPELIEFLNLNGAENFRILSLSPTGRAIKIWEDLRLHSAENRWLDEELYKLSDKLKINIYAGFCSIKDFPNIIKLNGHEECYGWINRCHVDAYGYVFPCTASSGHINLSIGNVRDYNLDLSELWFKTSPLEKFNPCKVINYFKKSISSAGSLAT